jgi:CBS domain-containing protein
MPIHKRYKKIIDVKVKDVMVSPVITLGIDSSLNDAVEVMAKEKIGSLIIVDDSGKMAGIITERDIIYAASRGLFKKDELKVKDIMSKNVITVSADSNINEAIYKMRNHNVRHLPVIDNEAKPIGIISFRDLLDFAISILKIMLLPNES